MSFGELQKQVLSQLERDYTNFKKTGQARRTNIYLKTLLELLEGHLNSAKRYHEEIVSEGKLEEGLKKEEMISVFDQINDTYLEYRCELLDALDRVTPSTPHTPTLATAPTLPPSSKQHHQICLSFLP